MRSAAANRHSVLRKENQMDNTSVSQGPRTTARILGLAAVMGVLAGCVQDDRSALERAQLQNLTSETALNAQIISDRARAQRCDRDASRREC